MKTIIKNHDSVITIFLAMLMIFFGQNVAYGLNVADRTPQVRDAIVAAAGVDTPAEVTEDHLSAITALSLGLSDIVSLKAGDFEGLTGLQVLLLNNNHLTALPETVFNGLASLQVLLLNNNALSALPETVFSDLTALQALRLNDNQLTALPAGVFSGLTALRSLNLDNNGVAPIGLQISLESVAAGQFKAVVPTGATFDIQLPFRITNGDRLRSGETVLTIPQGSVESEIFTVTRTPGTLAAVTVAIETLPELPVNHSGYAVVKSGDLPLVLIGSEGIYPLTDRTPQVRDAIITAAGVNAPAEVTEAHLSAITALSLSFNNITALNATDFDGLTSLQYLYLDNNALSALPAGVFSGLTSLQVLLLNNNALTDLPAGVFNGLASLEALLLNNNQLAALPETVFSGLTSLQYLYLDTNQLTALPETVFSGLTSLQYLYLDNNAVAPVALPVSLERVAAGQFKAVVPTGATFDMRLPIQITNGDRLIGGASSLVIPQGSVESEIFTVTRTPGTLAAVTAAIGVLPGLPEGHSGYAVVASGDLPLVLIRSVGINPLRDRTPQVQNAIVIAAGVNTPEEVTEDHLSAITALNLAFSNITTLKAGDFDDLTALEVLFLNDNLLAALPAGIFSGLPALQQLNLNNNQFTELPAPVFNGLPALQQLNLNNNQLTLLPETVFSGLPALQYLDLYNNRLTALPAGIFGSLTSLQSLYLDNNRLTALPVGVFSGLTSLQSLYLDNNAMAPIDLTVSLERVGEGQFKAVAPTGAPFDIRLPFRITNGRISSGETDLTIPQGSVESEVLTVDHTFENLQLVTADIEALPELPFGHSGYGLVKSSDLPVALLRSDGIHPISARTPEVQNAIVAAAGVNFPEEVTEDLMSAITALNLGLSNITALKVRDFEGLTALQLLLLNNNPLTALPTGVFEGLPSLQHLDLSANQLTFLPDGVFSGLMALQSVNLSSNAVDPMGLTVSLEKVAAGEFRAVVPTGAPFDIVMPIQITNGSLIGGATALTIPQGHVESEILTVDPTPGTMTPVTAAIETLPDLPAGHSGYALVKSSELPIVLIGSEGIHPLSDRTPQVRDAIVGAAGVTSPEEVTEAHLAAITSLNLSLSQIASLNAGDFEGLTALQVLFLNNNALTDLPETIFTDLTSLQYLYLNNNFFTFLPAGVFSGLTALQQLNLSNNQLTDLPASVFTDLTSLQHLNLSTNALTFLPDGVFNGLTALQYLYIDNNGVAPIGLQISLESVAAGQFKAVVPTGATFDMRLPIQITNGSLVGGATSLTIPQGSVESEIFTVTRTPGTFAAVTAAIGTLPVLPAGHSGYAVVKASELPIVLIGSAGINPLSGRTPEVQHAIVAAAGVTSADEVTADLMSAITALDLTDRSIVSLKAGDFEGLTALQHLSLSTNELTFLPAGVFSGLTSLQQLNLSNNALILLPVGVFSGLASLQELLLNNNRLTALPATVFNDLTSLQHLDLSANRLTFLPDGVFSGLTSLQQLRLSSNAVEPMGLTVSLERVAEGQFRAVVPTGAPFDILLPLRISNGLISGGATSLTIPQGSMESEMLSVTQTFENLMTVTADIDTLPELPFNHSGYGLVKSSELPIVLLRSDRINPISARTPQVQNAILAAAGVNFPEEVTEAHLASITSLSLGMSDITVLNDRDFEGLTSLQLLFLNNNALTDLPATVFSSLTALQYLNLESNQLTVLPAGVFSGLTSLQHLSLGNNAVAPIPLSVSLEKVAEGQFKAVMPTGAPFDVVLPIQIINGSLIGGATALTIPQGHLESEMLTVTRTPGTLAAVTAAIETLPVLPFGHSGYAVVKSSELPIVLIAAPGNTDPVFTEGDSTSRTVAENTATGTAIGAPVAATDADGDVLTYSLGGTDAASFRIVSTSGQLQTRAPLDYETQNVYAVTVSVSDGAGGSASIAVTINVTDVNEDPTNTAPVFTEGDSTTREIAENTVSAANIGAPVAATDADGDTLTYTLGGTDASSFSIVSTSGQLQTSEPLDYETQTTYTVVVSVSDGSGGSDSITVTITVTDVDEAPPPPVTNTAPVFTEGSSTTREIAENTASGTNIGAAVAATDADGDTLTYGLGGTDASSFGIVSTTGQLQTSEPLDYETQNTYTVVVSVADGEGGGDSIAVTITVTDVDETPVPTNTAPVFTEGDSTSRSIAENTASGTNIGTPVAATDADGDTLTYTLGGTDASSFSIVSTSGQLQTSEPLDYETQTTYTVIVSVSDGSGGSDSITVTITVTDVNENPVLPPPVTNNAPSFAEGDSTSRSVEENAVSVTAIGTPVAAADADGDTLTYSLGGTHASSFSIVNTSGQLQTRASLDFETQNTYTVVVSVSDDNGGTDSIDVTINVTNLNDNAPVFTDGTSTTRSVAEGTTSGRNIGSAVGATDADGDTLTYTLGGTDASSFNIVSTSGQLQTKAALDYETRTAYAVTVTVTDGSSTDSIDVAINVTDVTELPGGITPVGQRTRQVRDAIVAAVPGVHSPDNVTAAHLAAITSLELFEKDIKSLKSGDFSGLTALASLDMHLNSISDISELSGLTSLTTLDLQGNAVSDISALDDLTNLEVLRLANNAISDISALDDLTRLTAISLQGNSVSDISALDELTRLRTLNLQGNKVSDISALDDLTSLVDLELGSNSVSDISALDDLTSLSILGLANNSIRIISAVEDLTSLTFLYLRGNRIADYGPLRRLVAAIEGDPDHQGLTLDITIPDNNAPVFTEGASASRSVAENTGSGENIGTPVTATDADVPHILTYSLGGADASSFSIVSTSGQLQTKAALDFETDASYTVTVSVTDGTATVSIDVTIALTDVNEAPSFASSTVTRSVAENTTAGTNFDAAVAATDVDAGDTLTYTLGGTHAASFGIVSTSGQLQAKAALDFETTTSYSVTVTVTDAGNLTDSIDVTITVTNVNDIAPAFRDGESVARSVAENTASGENIGGAIVATDVEGDTLTYTLGGTDSASFDIVSTSGQLQTKAALDYETKSSYSVTVTADDGGFTDTITVTITVTDANDAPVFTDGDSATRSVAENTAAGQNIGTAVVATDADRVPDPNNAGQFIAKDTLTYSLSGDDAASFDIVSTSGQLQTKAALNHETKGSYSVTVSVSDGAGGSDSIPVTITVTDVNDAPTFTDGDTATRSVAENTGSGQNIGTAVVATDADRIPDPNNAGEFIAKDTLTYSLGGDDADAFSIVSTSGQLQTKDALNHETDDSYSVTVSVSDGAGGSDSIAVTIEVTDVNEAPKFAGSTATRSVAENTASETNVGAVVTASDPDSDTLTYSISGTDFTIDSASGQIQTKAALDFETKTSYSVTVTATDPGNLTDTIAVTINVTDVNEAPSFTEGESATRSVAENTVSGQSIGTAVGATDPDSDTLAYSLGGVDKDSFSIVGTSGQLRTSAALNYESKSAYFVTVTVTDGHLTDTISVKINVTDVDENRAPIFSDGASTTRSVAENTSADENIGTAVTATDADNDTLTYSLSGDDVASFSIVSTSGQLQTKAALNFEAKRSYSVTVSVSDGAGGSDSITVTVNVTNVDEPPSFTAGESATRSVAENTAASTNIGTAFGATDPENHTITYSLSGDDAASFAVVSTTGQLRTKSALNFEMKASYTVTVLASASGGSDEIDVTITVTDVNEAPTFTEGESATRSVAENTAASTNIGTAVGATDVDRIPDPNNEGQFLPKDTLTYSLSGDDAASFDIVSTSGQLQTKAALNHETDDSYSVTVSVSDGEGGSDSIDVTIEVTDVNEAPAFAAGASISNISATTGTAITSVTLPAATDVDGDSLTYTLTPTLPTGLTFTASTRVLGGTPTAETASATYTYKASDGTLSASLTFMIEVGVPPNNAPTFDDGADTTRSVAENTDSGQNIGSAVGATDADGDTLTYSLSGDDAASFDIVATSGQLRTSAALNHETKDSYSVTVSVSDGKGGSDSIAVTINVTDVNEAPHFSRAKVTISVAEDTSNGTDIGDPFQATDPEGDTLTYSLHRGDRNFFSIDDSTGQLSLNTALDYDAKNTYDDLAVRATDPDGLFDTILVTVNVTEVAAAPAAPSVPAKTALLPNYPNPFNPETWIPYKLSESAAVTLTLYNMRGVVVREIKLGHQPAGVYTSRSRAIHWDGRNAFGEKVATGVYFYTLTAGDYTATRKLLIRK